MAMPPPCNVGDKGEHRTAHGYPEETTHSHCPEHRNFKGIIIQVFNKFK